MRKKSKEELNPSEVTKILNNALVLSSSYLNQYVESASIPDGVYLKNKRTLREYTEGLVEAPLAHIKEGLILPQEIVLVLLASAAMVQQLYVDKNSKIDIGKIFNE